MGTWCTDQRLDQWLQAALAPTLLGERESLLNMVSHGCLDYKQLPLPSNRPNSICNHNISEGNLFQSSIILRFKHTLLMTVHEKRSGRAKHLSSTLFYSWTSKKIYFFFFLSNVIGSTLSPEGINSNVINPTQTTSWLWFPSISQCSLTVNHWILPVLVSCVTFHSIRI